MDSYLVFHSQFYSATKHILIKIYSFFGFFFSGQQIVAKCLHLSAAVAGFFRCWTLLAALGSLQKSVLAFQAPLLEDCLFTVIVFSLQHFISCQFLLLHLRHLESLIKVSLYPLQVLSTLCILNFDYCVMSNKCN